MRRRRAELPAGVGGVPESLAVFSEDDGWPGRTAYERFVAWVEARGEWAEASLPRGRGELDDWFPMPDAPFDPDGEDADKI